MTITEIRDVLDRAYGLSSVCFELLGQKESELENKMLKQNLGPVYTYFKQVKSVLQLKGIQARLPYDIVFQ